MTELLCTLSSEQITQAIDYTIQQRKTVKALGDIQNPVTVDDSFQSQVDAALQVSGWAPFHYQAHANHCTAPLDSPVPWRFHALTQNNALELAKKLIAHPHTELDESSKIIRMIASCGALVLVTWLPDPNDSLRCQKQERGTQIMEEHIAATAAATQNLLLTTQARGIASYWSSGGELRGETCFQLCGIPLQEKLLGAVFLYPNLTENIDVRPGGQRERRGTSKQWSRWIEL